MSTWVDLEALAAVPAWPLARQLALAGRCRGALLRDWGGHVRRRAGDAALARLREAVGIPASALPDRPKAGRWYPVAYQVALTRAIVDHALDGDVLALEPLLVEDGLRAKDRIIQLALRTVGPRRVLAGSARIHRHLYDVGRADAVVEGQSATISFHDAAVFGNPTWRVMQLFAIRAMLRGFGRAPTRLDADVGHAERFAVQVAWR